MRYINIINSCHPSITTFPLKVTPSPRISRFSINPGPSGVNKGKLMKVLTLNHPVYFSWNHTELKVQNKGMNW